MKRFEVRIEVGAIDPTVVEQLKAAGHRVFRAGDRYRVDATAPAYGGDSVRAQAHVLVLDVIANFALNPLGDPPRYTIVDPDAFEDDRPDLALRDARGAEESEPIARPRERWWRSIRDRRNGFRDY